LPPASKPANPLTQEQIALIETAFQNQFGQTPQSIHVGGSYAEGTATAASDIDVLLETELNLPRFSPAWFDFLKAINPGIVPLHVTGVGPGPGQALIGSGPGDIPKAGLLDPFFKAPGTLRPPTIQVR
jgi:hypothetical protein